jgi:hypothetical protein
VCKLLSSGLMSVCSASNSIAYIEIARSLVYRVASRYCSLLEELAVPVSSSTGELCD